MSDDLLIVGAGVLGSPLGQGWKSKHAGCTVFGETITDKNHPRLEAAGILPRLRHEPSKLQALDNVVFCAPPSGSEDYVGEVKRATRLWTGHGGFVFTSSAAVYATENGGPCDEDSPIAPAGLSERVDRLLKAEEAVLEAGGCVLRLVGLYHAHRGAHTAFLRMGQVPRWGGYTVNLIHYEDGASLTAAILEYQRAHRSSEARRIFVGCDGAPVTFQAMMQAVTASKCYDGSVDFTGQQGSNIGKVMSNDRTRQILDWQPKHSSFIKFIQDGALDGYNTSSAEHQ